MNNLFGSGGGLFLPEIARIGWLRSLLWRWDQGSRGESSLAERMPVGQAA
ncbi:MAG: hypothetical protein HQL67_04245 [Magnetococcales bacterium]|nr:hypothetical protein [Magnetococcales bacterium]